MLTLIATGDQAAFSQLFSRYRDKVYTTARRITGSDIEGEEIVQDVFLKIWMKKETLVSINDLDAYIFIIARNQTFNALRRLLNERKKGNAWPKEHELSVVSPESLLDEKDFQRVLEKALDRLPPRQRSVYSMIKIGCMTKENVAEKLGISPNTVKTHFDAAVRSVRAYCMVHMELAAFICFWFIRQG